MSRYAAIDIGSNSTLLLIVERKHLGGVRVLVDTKLSTKLSSGAEVDKAITPAAIERQLVALDKIQELLSNYHAPKIVVCATQVFRATGNGQELAERIAHRYGWQVEIIEGKREAELSYQAAAVGLTGVPERRLVLDVGGGSTEVAFGTGSQMEFGESFPVGAVKLSEACALTDKAAASAIAAAKVQVISTITAESIATIPPGLHAIAVGGTAATLAALRLGRQVFDPALIHGVRLSREWLAQTEAELAELNTSERRARLLFDPDRAEIIVGGCMIVNYLVDTLQLDGLTVSNRGLRWGMLFDRYRELAQAAIKQEQGH